MTYTKKATHKTVSWTPSPEVAEMLWKSCAHSDPYWAERLLVKNPQNVVRTALFKAGIVPKDQWGGGDRTNWERGQSLKTSLWPENADSLTEYAAAFNKTKQQVLEEVVAEYLSK